MFQPVVNLFHPLCFLSDQLVHASVIAFNDTAPVMLVDLLHKNQFQTKTNNRGIGSLMVLFRLVIYHLLKKKKTIY